MDANGLSDMGDPIPRLGPGQSPSRGSGEWGRIPPEADAYLLMNA